MNGDVKSMQRYNISGLAIPQLTVLTGALMVFLGLVFFVHTDYLTALFPTLFGGLLLFAGIVSVRRPELNALSMHIAVVTSLVSTALGLTSALFGTWTTTTSLVEQLLMSAITGAHLYVCMAAYRFGRARFPDDSQTCGIGVEAVAERTKSPGPVSVVAISLE